MKLLERIFLSPNATSDFGVEYSVPRYLNSFLLWFWYLQFVIFMLKCFFFTCIHSDYLQLMFLSFFFLTFTTFCKSTFLSLSAISILSFEYLMLLRLWGPLMKYLRNPTSLRTPSIYDEQLLYEDTSFSYTSLPSVISKDNYTFFIVFEWESSMPIKWSYGTHFRRQHSYHFHNSVRYICFRKTYARETDRF